MDKADFLVIFPTFENLEVVKQTLPSVIEAVNRSGSDKLIVHDCSVRQRTEKREYLQELNKNNDFMLILSDRISMAHARNLCLKLGNDLYNPDYILMLEDDHGLSSDALNDLKLRMEKYYGKESPNGLRYGMFSACYKHTNANFIEVNENWPYSPHYPSPDSDQLSIGGMNSCFRCAPSSHWSNVLKEYDTDEYNISEFQTVGMRLRNYHKGYTVMFVGDGKLCFDVEHQGVGMSSGSELKPWDNRFTKSDRRSNYAGK